MRFGDLKTKIRALIWAAGEAENLVIAHDNMFQEAMGFLQVNVPEEKDQNTDVYPFCSTFFKCGLTVVPLPVGVIERVFTIANNNWCDPVYYDEKSRYEPERWARNVLFYAKNANSGLPALPLGYQAADKSTDLLNSRVIYASAPYPGRARRGIWAKDARNINVAPWLQSNETLVIIWKGTKQQWSDDDLVSDQIDVQKFIKLYVTYAHERDFGNGGQMEKMTMTEALGDVMIEWRVNTRLHRERSMEWRDRTAAELQESNLPTATVPPIITFAQTGNGLQNGANQRAVASLIDSWTPDMLLYAGNLSISGDYDTDFGVIYAKYIFPYVGAHGPGASSNKLWPCPGYQEMQHGIENYLTYFTSLQQKCYYDLCTGNVHFFFIDNVAEDTTDPDGYDGNSSQAAWLRTQLALSTATWKIVIGNYDPYTSDSGSGSWASAQWTFKTWGADLVITGKARVYERLSVAGLPFIVNGLGGSNMDSFGTIDPNSVVRYDAAYGALKGVVNGKTLTLEFWNVAGVKIDSLVLTKP